MLNFILVESWVYLQYQELAFDIDVVPLRPCHDSGLLITDILSPPLLRLTSMTVVK